MVCYGLLCIGGCYCHGSLHCGRVDDLLVLNEIEGFVQTMDEVFIAWWLKQVDDMVVRHGLKMMLV